MVVRFGYALLAVCLFALAGTFAVRLVARQPSPLPVVTAPREMVGLSCTQGLEKARALSQGPTLDRARLAYLWLVSHCDGSAALPEALLEAGSLFAYWLHEPQMAYRLYGDFLRRFPARPEAADALYQLAKLDIDAGNYGAAAAHLTELARRFPNDPHGESAKFLAAKATQLLAAHKRSLRTLPGRLMSMVPNNLFSLLALLAAVGPAAIHAVKSAKGESGGDGASGRWTMPTLIIILTLLNYIINSFQSSRQNALLMQKLDQLTAVRTHVQGDS